MYGKALVSEINSKNEARMFGQIVTCFGTNNIKQALKVKGAGIKYLNLDELATFPEEVVVELIPCLDKPYSVADGTLNPLFPTHHVKKLIDDNPKYVYYQKYTIWDNPFLPENERDFILSMYPVGSVWYKRYCEGEWAVGSGIVFPLFAENPNKFIKPVFDKKTGHIERFAEIIVALDCGENRSNHALSASGITKNWRGVHALATERHPAKDTTPEQIEKLFLDFLDKIMMTYGNVRCVFFDGAQYMGNKLRISVRKKYPLLQVAYAKKPEGIERIQALTDLMALGRFHMTDDCESLVDSLTQLVWHPDKPDTILDDYSTPVDDYDSFCYTFTHRIKNFIK